jgi:hypothetical protein
VKQHDEDIWEGIDERIEAAREKLRKKKEYEKKHGKQQHRHHIEEEENNDGEIAQRLGIVGLVGLGIICIVNLMKWGHI